MFTLVEKESCKIPEETSIFLKLEKYIPKNLFDVLVQIDNSVYIKKNNVIEFPINSFAFVVDVLTGFDDVRFIPMKKEFCPYEDVQIGTFRHSLYQHQIDAIKYGLCKDSWMLLDDCGLGKTLSMIYLAEELHKKFGLEHCFVICGVNSLKYNWVAEIEKFSDLSCTILGMTTTKKGTKKFCSVSERCSMVKGKIDEFFVITNIETLQNKEFANSFNKSKSSFDMIVLDEAHRCKNPTSLSAKTLLKLHAKYKIALTGTLIMNNPENAYVPLKWTENVRCNFSEFKRMFNVYGGFGGVQIVEHKNLDILKDLISSCSLRRRKADVLDLPEKTYVIDYVEMGQEQRKLYDDVSEGVTAELNLLDHQPSVLEELAINLRLRQITAYPGSISSVVCGSAKLDRLCELVDDIVQQGDKVVVFNSFKDSAEEVYRRLNSYGCVICTGDQSELEINERKEQFQNNDKIKVMSATWQKMGTGHTLTAANYCIFVDTPWTDADFQQAADRIYRIGQNKKVTIITLITKDTYDERVEEILQRKEKISGYLVDGKLKSVK
jgi:SNF2 family DNA or RNA helicase